MSASSILSLRTIVPRRAWYDHTSLSHSLADGYDGSLSHSHFRVVSHSRFHRPNQPKSTPYNPLYTTPFTDLPQPEGAAKSLHNRDVVRFAVEIRTTCHIVRPQLPAVPDFRPSSQPVHPTAPVLYGRPEPHAIKAASGAVRSTDLLRHHQRLARQCRRICATSAADTGAAIEA